MKSTEELHVQTNTAMTTNYVYLGVFAALVITFMVLPFLVTRLQLQYTQYARFPRTCR